jgi:hypothetical protein
MFVYSICGKKFDEERRMKIHFKTYEKRDANPKNKKEMKYLIFLR